MKNLIVIFLLTIACYSNAYCIDTAKVAQHLTTTVVKKDTFVSPKNGSISNPAADTAKTKTPVVVKCANPDKYQTVGWILIIAIIVFFIWVATSSNLLRDAITDPAVFLAAAQAIPKYRNVTDINKIPRPFSLSRSQLGLWTVVIGCAYLYLEFCRHCCFQLIPLDKDLLALMGISAGTAAVGNVIDNNNSTVVHHQDGPSDNFLQDILSDQYGLSVHRFQNVIWTIITVTIFISQLPDVQCAHMPMLDSTLIALTGISSLTYLGLKVNENKPPVPPIAPPSQPVVSPAPPIVPAPVVVPPPAPVVPPVQPVVAPQPPVDPPAAGAL